MPKIATNWETTEVSFYKFVCKNPDILYSYVGHTTSFRHRKAEHKSNCTKLDNRHYNLPVYVFMREQGGWENWDMVQIHSQICKDVLHARQIENELIEQQQFKLNAKRAYISEEQRKERDAKWADKYYDTNRAEILVKVANYREKNRDVINAKQNKHYETHCVEILEHRSTYYENNRAKILERTAKYREANRDSINAHAREYSREKRALKKATQ